LGHRFSENLVSPEDIHETGDVALRIVASYPNMAGLYRFDQLIAALARHSIWLTDAYFLATAPYVKALGAAAMDGVDVRLLLPRTSDVPVVRALSRAGYRTFARVGSADLRMEWADVTRCVPSRNDVTFITVVTPELTQNIHNDGWSDTHESD